LWGCFVSLSRSGKHSASTDLLASPHVAWAPQGRRSSRPGTRPRKVQLPPLTKRTLLFVLPSETSMTRQLIILPADPVSCRHQRRAAGRCSQAQAPPVSLVVFVCCPSCGFPSETFLTRHAFDRCCTTGPFPPSHVHHVCSRARGRPWQSSGAHCTPTIEHANAHLCQHRAARGHECA
jgi:hypothetical protein